MKIEGRCRVCGRSFPIDLLAASPSTAGRCPFCGTPLDQHYAALLIEAVGKLQRAGTAMERILEEASRLGPNLEIDAESVLEPIRGALRTRQERSVERLKTEPAPPAPR